MLAARVSKQRVAGPEVHGRNAEHVEPGHVSPAQLGTRRAARRRSKRRGSGAGETGSRPANGIGDRNLPAGEHLMYVVRGLCGRSIGCESVVDGHDALIRYDIAGNPAPDADRVQALAEPQAIYLRLPRLIAAQDSENLRCLVDRVAAHPCTRAMRTFSACPDLGTKRALATAFHDAARRL